MSTAFEPVRIGRHTARNRVVMAPMTRSRAHGPGGVPTELMATYYAQRAGAGLIVTEGTQPSPIGRATSTRPACTRRAGRRLAGGHRRGPRAGRPHLRPAHAHRPDRSPEPLPAVGDPRRRRPRSRPTARSSPPTARADLVTPELSTTDPADRRGLRRRGPQRRRGRLRRRGAARRQRLSARTSSWPPAATGAPTRGAAAEGRDPLRRRRGRGGRRRDRRRPGGPADLAVQRVQRHRRGRPRETYAALLAAIDPLGLAYLHVAEGAGRGLHAAAAERWRGTLILNPFTPGADTGPDALRHVENGAATWCPSARCSSPTRTCPTGCAPARTSTPPIQQGLRRRPHRLHGLSHAGLTS